MNTQNANSIRQSLKRSLFKDKKYQCSKQDNNIYHDLPIVTLYKNFDEVYRYKKASIGQGAHGIVKICHKKYSEQQTSYAVKIFRTGDPEIINTIKKTFKINRSLNQLPCVIKAIDLFINVTKEEIHLVMELCRYPSLEKLIRNNELNSCQQKKLLLELAKAINAIHEKCVCHRDLKPDNILVQLTNEEATIKIIDFGVSKNFITKTKNLTETIEMWTRTGSVFYQAPEIFEGGGYDQKVDIWSVGIIAFQLFCKRLPFQSELICDTIERICDPNSNVENQIGFEQLDVLQQDLLRRLLKKDPEKRLSSREFILHPWLHPQGQTDQNQIYHLRNDEKSNSLSTSEQLISIQQFDNNIQLVKEPFCVSTVLQFEGNNQPSASWSTLGNHIYFYSSSKQLNQEQEENTEKEQQCSLSKFHEMQEDDNEKNLKNMEDENELIIYKTVGSIILS